MGGCFPLESSRRRLRLPIDLLALLPWAPLSSTITTASTIRRRVSPLTSISRSRWKWGIPPIDGVYVIGWVVRIPGRRAGYRARATVTGMIHNFGGR